VGRGHRRAVGRVACGKGRSVGGYLAETIAGLLVVGLLAAVVVWLVY
jgi:hypothetical protein